MWRRWRGLGQGLLGVRQRRDTINRAEFYVSAARSGIADFADFGLAFRLVNCEPAIRQLQTVAELGEDEPTSAPQFMRLSVVPAQPRIACERLGFRNEVRA